MSADIYSLFQDTNKETFAVVYNGKKYSYQDFAACISKLEKSMLEIKNNVTDVKVYLDIKDKFLFFVSFYTFMKLNANTVLIPMEIKSEDYTNDHDLFISDNKHLQNGLFIDSNFNLTKGANFDNCHILSCQGQTAVYLYTSGSTGKSKLIPKSSTNILTEVKALKPILNMQATYKAFFTPPIYHIYGMLMDMLLPTYVGCTIYLDDCFSPASIADYVEQNKIDFFVSTPSYYRMFKDLQLINKFKSCTQFTSSSAPLDLDISKAFLEQNLKITEIYGSTETGGIAHRVGAITQDWTLFPYVTVKNTTTVDGISEFLIDSATISVEYDEYGYNTNDLVKFSNNDYNKFQLVGRNTRFVKISGKRLDLQYVFSKLAEYFLTFGKEANTDNMYVGATKDEKIYVIYNGDFPSNPASMKENLKQMLPGYGVPRFFINSKIPRNSMSKIDKVKIDEIVNSHVNSLK